MVFRSKGARTFKVKVAIPTRKSGKSRTFSTGATVKTVAVDVERMVKRLIGRREFAALELVFDDLEPLGAVYDADVAGTLADLIARHRDVDLEPLVMTWAKKADPKYVRQVRRLIADGERFPASAFRRKRISDFLESLTCADPTRNRYRAALSGFAKWLVEKEVIESNPVRDVAMYPENDPRMMWMTWPQLQIVAGKADPSYRTLIRLMAATGIELGVALTLRKEDVNFDERTINTRGSKTIWRNRVVRFEAWETEDLRSLVEWLGAGALLFPFADGATALDEFKAAQQAAEMSGHRLHDLRHTYAVNALRQGYKPTVVAHQLGHKDATMVTKVYGRFIPDKSDYVVTNPATTTSSDTRGDDA